jgi:hypothetical protein
MTLSGVGAGIAELTALAVTSELAPTRKRGKYVAVLVFTIIPFCPSVLWAQLIASHAGWRYCGALIGAWNAVGLFGTLFFYFPPPRPNSRGLSRREVIAEIDFVGGFLSIVGMILFLGGLQWGGYQVRNYRIRPKAVARLTLRVVQMDLCPRPRSLTPRSCILHCLRRLGNQGCQIPHVPISPQAGTSNSGSDTDHHLHLRRQLLFRDHVLANTGLQCLRP